MSDHAPNDDQPQRKRAAAKPRASKAGPPDPVKKPAVSRRTAPIQAVETHPVMPEDILEMQEEMQARVQANPNASWQERKQWTEEFCDRFGPRWGSVILSTINKLASTRMHAGTTINNNNVVAAGLEAMATAAQGHHAVAQVAKRDQIGVTGGEGNMVEAGDIRVFNEWVTKQGASQDQHYLESFKACYRELRTACPDPDEAEVLLSHFRTLSEEMLKDAGSRKDIIIRMSRAAIVAALPTDKKFPGWDSITSMCKSYDRAPDASRKTGE